MYKSYLPIWLPLSIVLHVILVALLLLMPQSPTPVAADPITTPVEFIDEQPPVLPDQPPAAIAPRPVTTTHTLPGLPNVRRTNGGSTSPIKSTQPGPGKPAAAPEVLTSPESVWETPNGIDGSTGTLDKSLAGKGEGGASSGAVSLGGRNPGYPKLAQERGASGTAIVAVTISPTGSIDNITLVQRTGDRDLDDAAQRAARSWQFRAAVQHGKPVSSTVRIRFIFANGTVSGTVL